MRTYLCVKPCTLSGAAFKAGDVISEELIVPERVKKLIALGLITEMAETSAPPLDAEENAYESEEDQDKGPESKGKRKSRKKVPE